MRATVQRRTMMDYAFRTNGATMTLTQIGADALVATTIDKGARAIAELGEVTRAAIHIDTVGPMLGDGGGDQRAAPGR